MIHAYEDEDNSPMYGDLPLPYPIKTWDEMMKAWEGERNGQDMDGGKAEGKEYDGHGAADVDRG